MTRRLLAVSNRRQARVVACEKFQGDVPMRKFFPLIVLAPLLLFGCIFQPIIREITVHNAADYAAEDSVITYYHGTRGRQIERIGALQPGETRVLSVVTKTGALADS